MRLLLRSHGVGSAFGGVIKARFLHYASASLNHFNLPFNFVFQRRANEAKTIHIFHFCLGAELLRPLHPHADIGIAAQRALLHIAIAHRRVQQNLLDPRQIFVRFLGGANVRLTHNFHQRRAAPVQVDVGALARVVESFVHTLAGVLFHVQSCDADTLCSFRRWHIDPAVLAERLVELGDLVAFRQVGIEIIFARKD